MANRVFDEQMAALDALKGRELDADAIALIAKSLANRSNFLVAKAARLAQDGDLISLLPEILAAFDRFFTHAEKSDPQCWAKNALSSALTHLECRDKDVYLRGLRHRQMEPTWGGKSDSAATLRATCTHALVACNDIANQDLLILLLDPLVDPDKTVRVEAARAMGQIGLLAVPVLRLRALIPGEEPEVLAACFASLLAIEREQGVAFVAAFLTSDDDRTAEAAFALAETHQPAALTALLGRHRDGADVWLNQALLSSIALTRLPEAEHYLLALVENEESDAAGALEALGRIAPNDELRARIGQAVQRSGSPRLATLLREAAWNR